MQAFASSLADWHVQARLAAAETEAVNMQSDNEVQVAGLAARLQSIVQEHQAAKSGLHIKLQAMQQDCKTQVGELTRRLQSVHSEHQADVSDLSRVLRGVQQKLTADAEQVRQQQQALQVGSTACMHKEHKGHKCAYNKCLPVLV